MNDEQRARYEYELYKDPAMQEPQGPPIRRKQNLTELVPVRFTEDVLSAVRELADAEDRSVSSWIRVAVQREVARQRRRAPR